MPKSATILAVSMHLAQQHARFGRLQARGQVQWFGLACDGTLAATTAASSAA